MTEPVKQWPRVLFVGRWDWANLCHGIARALNAHTGETIARVIVQHRHPFGYEEDIVLDECAGGRLQRSGSPSPDDVAAITGAADWLITTGDGAYDWRAEIRTFRKDVKIAVTHAGSAYRDSPVFYNLHDRNTLQARLRFIGMDSIRLSGYPEGVRDPKVRPHFGVAVPAETPAPIDGPIVVSHSPSVRAKKGTDLILPVLHELEADGLIRVRLIEGVKAPEALAMRAGVHVHVDQMVPEIGGFGQSAIEALAHGSVVLADVRHVTRDDSPPISHVDTPDDLRRELRALVSPARRHELRAKQVAALDWSRTNSSPAAQAKRWLKCLEEAHVEAGSLRERIG